MVAMPSNRSLARGETALSVGPRPRRPKLVILYPHYEYSRGEIGSERAEVVL